MKTYPDKSMLPPGFDALVADKAINGGVMRHELESLSGQSCYRWFRYVRSVAEARGLHATRDRYAVGTFTRFEMVKGTPR